MVCICPRAVHVGKLNDPIRILAHALGDVVVVVWIMVDAGADQHRLVDLVFVHFPQQLLYPPVAFEIGYLRLVRPVIPGVSVAINNHSSLLYHCKVWG